MPIEPVSIAASSLRMSPNRFSVTITSKSVGRLTSCIAALSTSRCSSGMSGRSPRAYFVTVSRHSRLVSMTFALSTLVTFVRAKRKPTSAIRSISLDAVGAGVVGGVAVAAAVAEVDAAGELAHDEQVGALDALAAQRAGVEQRARRADRAQVGEQLEPLAQAEQALLGARLRRVGRVPLGAADGGEQDGVGVLAGLERLGGERGAVLVDRGAADEVVGQLEGADPVEDLAGGVHDLGPDPVTGKGCNSYGFRHVSGRLSCVDVQADVVERPAARRHVRRPRRRTAS